MMAGAASRGFSKNHANHRFLSDEAYHCGGSKCGRMRGSDRLDVFRPFQNLAERDGPSWQSA
jgi:hypothetical protein